MLFLSFCLIEFLLNVVRRPVYRGLTQKGGENGWGLNPGAISLNFLG